MESRRFVFDPPACYGNMPYIGNRDSGFRGAETAMSMEDASRGRPFINSLSYLFDEDYCDEQLPDKKRRLTQEQVIFLEKSFEAENKLEPDRKIQLAKNLGLQPRQIAIWFQNRRARWKTKQLEREYDVLKSTYSSLLSDYDSIVKENEKLKFEVVSLSDKIDTKEGAGIPILPEKSNSSLADVTPNYSSGFGIKLEDGLSSGTGGSGVVDEVGPQLLDSGDSYFLINEFTVMDGMHSEEDDRCNHALSYFPDVFQQNHVEIETLCWWDWSGANWSGLEFGILWGGHDPVRFGTGTETGPPASLS